MISTSSTRHWRPATLTLWLVCSLILICLILNSGCVTQTVVPDDNVPVRLQAGNTVPDDLDGWYAISPGLLRKLYRDRRIETEDAKP